MHLTCAVTGEATGRVITSLVIGGGASSHIPQDRVAELARRIPGAASVTIPAGYLIHATDPEAFTQGGAVFPAARLSARGRCARFR